MSCRFSLRFSHFELAVQNFNLLILPGFPTLLESVVGQVYSKIAVTVMTMFKVTVMDRMKSKSSSKEPQQLRPPVRNKRPQLAHGEVLKCVMSRLTAPT